MKPIDRRLLAKAGPARSFIATTVAVGVVVSVLVVVQATLIAGLLVGTFLQQRGFAAQRGALFSLAAVLALRASLMWASELMAYRAAAAVRSELRRDYLRRLVDLGPGWLATRPTGELTLGATRGLDAVDGYFARYLPQLVLACLVPVVLGARVLAADVTSAVIVACTLPLIPVFMVLIGLGTKAQMDRQWSTLSRLSHHFLDVVAGLPTLRMFGRERAQVATIRRVSTDLRRSTMRTLRIAFLSSMVLELLASLSVALIAVSIGLRLVSGDLSLRTGLIVLLVAPEIYLPLRRVGAAYHASVEGVTALGRVLDVIDQPLANTERRMPPRPVPAVRAATIAIRGLTVRYPGRPVEALQRLDITVRPGELVAVVGPSGCGKSTLLAVLLGFVSPDAGSVRIGDVDLADLDPDEWRREIAWVGQRPHLFAGTIGANIRLGASTASDEAVRCAARAAAAEQFIEALPDGFETVVGEHGVGLSVGQRQRIAIARAYLRDAPLLLLDEPTTALDKEVEDDVVRALRELTRQRTVILTSHRPALFTGADRIVELRPPVAALANVDGLGAEVVA